MLIFCDFLKPKKTKFLRVNQRDRCRAKSEQRKRRKKGEKLKMNRRFGFKKSEKINIFIK